MSTTPRTNVMISGPLSLCFALVLGASLLQGCDGAESQPPELKVNPLSSSATPEIRTEKRIRCSTTSPPPEQRLAIEKRLAALATADLVERAPGSVRVPVFFHVITSSSGEGLVSETALRAQIRVLNDAFAGRAPGGAGAASPFFFELIDFKVIKNDAWFRLEHAPQPTQAEIDMKANNRGGKSTLNIYTIGIPARPFGWARYPWDPQNVQGVVISYRTLPGGNEPNYNQGDTGTHEVGHWLGLLHTFENGCNSRGDDVADTPPELGPTLMCPPSPDSCPGGGRDSVNNFMNFTNDHCMFQFTPGQATRMDLMHRQHRTETS